MKTINIISLVLSVLLIPITIYYMEEVSSARWANWDWGGYSNYADSSYKELTIQASLIVLIFIFYFIFVNIANLMKVKTNTSKAMSIIGISLVGLGFLFNLMVMGSDGGATFDEVGVIWILMALIMLAFSIVFLVQSINYKKKTKDLHSDEIVDDII